MDRIPKVIRQFEPARSGLIRISLFSSNLFNKLLWSDLIQCNMNVRFIHGLSEFLDINNMVLKDRYHLKRTNANNEEDTLHINHTTGVSLLVRLIKSAIFSCKRSGDKLTRGRSYSNTLRGGPVNPI